ncbi:MAG: hypothetical protein QXR60_03020 [Candidatus Nanoarchaeia archaeon]
MAKKEDYYEEPYVASQPPKKKMRGLGFILTIVILFMLVFGGLYAYYYLTSPGGQRFLGNVATTYQGVQSFFVDLFVQKPREVGTIFTAETNKTSMDYGVKFTKFESVGSKRIPAGSTASFKYVVTVGENVGNVKLNLACNVEPKDVVSGGINLIPNEPLKLSTENSAMANNLRCTFKTNENIEEDRTVTVKGKINFDVSDQRTSLKVYLLSQKEYEAFEGKDFFKENNIDEKLPIKAVYNGEPVEVGIGVSENLKQPVVVGDDYPVPLVGISLINRWDGKVTKIRKMLLFLPEGVTINKEMSPQSDLCPFSEGTSRGKYVEYIADEAILSNLPAFGSGEENNYQNFECWLKIEKSLVEGRKAGLETAYHTEISYDYSFNEKSDVITVSKRQTTPTASANESIEGGASA